VGKTVKEALKLFVKSQTASLKDVVPTHKYDPRSRIMYLDSPAGLLKVKFSRQLDVTYYRDKYVNQFELAVDVKEYFRIYKDIIKDDTKKKRTYYEANLNTRLKGVLCDLLKRK